MLQGVHAETIAFATYPQARGSLVNGSRPLIAASRDVLLRGKPPRRFRLQSRNVRETGKAVSCDLDFFGMERPFAPVMRVEVSFTPDGENTRVRLRGSTARNLSPTSPEQDEASRRLANEYARALLEEIAHAIEDRTAVAGNHTQQSKVHPRRGSKA